MNKSAMEMTGGGRRWKTLVSRYGSSKLDIEFPTAAPRPWKSPTTRFPHSHSAGCRFTYPNHKDKTKLAPFGRPDWREFAKGETPAARTTGA
jgi:hypothetical protein